MVEASHVPVTPAAVPRSPVTAGEAMKVETHKRMPQRHLLEIEESALIQFSSVQSLNPVRLSATHELQHARPPCLSPTPGVH